MRFTVSAASLLALAGSALAQTAGFDPISKPALSEVVPAGSTFDVVWEPSSAHPGAVTLTLLGGATPATLQTVATIKSGVASSAGKFAWSVDSTLGKDATYGIQITLDSDSTIFQYSFPFHIKAGAAPPTSSLPSGNSSVPYPTGTGTHSYSYKTSGSAIYTTTPTGNLSIPATYSPTTVVTSTSTALGSGPGASGSTTSGPATVPTSGAHSLAASSLAFLGGLAAAIFAL